MAIAGPDAGRDIGEILLASGSITQEQYDRALQIRNGNRRLPLNDIFIRIGVPQETVASALRQAGKNKTFGEYLVLQGFISRDQLAEASAKKLHIRERWGVIKQIGMLLLELGFIEKNVLTAALSKYLGLPIITLKGITPSIHMQQVIGERYAMEQKIIVLDNNPQEIKLVMAEPSNVIMEELKKVLPKGKKVEYYIATHDEIDNCLRAMSAVSKTG
ncbi:MAG TPA: hypothetical protein P5244_09870 [Syntrophales bacterium]|nr:hypothetical protein [Syntrophales bacterium]